MGPGSKAGATMFFYAGAITHALQEAEPVLYRPSGAVAASSQTLVASSTCGRTSRRTLA